MSDTALLAAERLAQGGAVQEAIKVFITERAKENPPPRQLTIHGMLGDLYSMQFETDRAVADFDLAPGAQREDCLKQAKENFLRSLETDPEHCHLLLHLADLEFNAGDFKDAQDHYWKLSALSPKDPLPMVRMAHAMHSSGDPQGTLVSLQQALDRILAGKKSPGWERNTILRETEVDCQLYRAEVLRALSNPQEARKEYEAVLNLTAPTKKESVTMEESVTMKMKSCREWALEMLRANWNGVSAN